MLHCRVREYNNYPMQGIFRALLLSSLVFTCSISVSAESFPAPGGADNVVGEIRYTQVRRGETLVDIAREFNLGYDQIVRANPGMNRWLPDEGAQVVLPHQYVLVGNIRSGIVLNIAELRLYYYPPTRKGFSPEVITYPVSIGRMDWRTPLGKTSVVKKERDPAWRPPPSIRREHELDGDPLPEVIAGGAPDNPLGRFALRLGFPSYLIHGVDERKAYGIGMRVTHGCIRMYPEDIESLFSAVSVGTPVMIVNEPIKLGRNGEQVLLEVHQPLDEREDEDAPEAPRISAGEVLQFVRNRLQGAVEFDERLVIKIAEVGDGVPTEIARTTAALPGISAGIARPAVVLSGESSKRKSALDQEYEKAVSRHLADSGDEAATKQLEPRRSPLQTRKATLPDVQRYLEEHY